MKNFILHIEDSEVDHELFKRAVNNSPSKWFRTTSEGEAFLNQLSEDTFPSIIVIDLNLPAENGIRLIHRLKSNLKFKKIPIIVFSSVSDIREINECYIAGANAFLQKTLKADEQMSKLTDLVNFWLVSTTLPY